MQVFEIVVGLLVGGAALAALSRRIGAPYPALVALAGAALALVPGVPTIVLDPELALALFVALGVFGVRAALRAPDTFGMLLAAGITTWFVVQAVVNIGAVVGLLPITGVPLPFVSYGGTALVVNLTAMGVLLSVARQGRDR